MIAAARTGEVERESADACPGALRPHHAADGELLRLRVPGGAIDPSALRALATASDEFADGAIGLTSRGNLQVRGATDASMPALLPRLREAGLLSPAGHDRHERVRNVIASPLSGRGSGARADVDPLVTQLDGALCERPGLAELPGRFLFALDDGSGDVAGEGADVLALALGAGWFAVRPAGCRSGVRVRGELVVTAMLAVAEQFLLEREALTGRHPQAADRGQDQNLDRDRRAWRIAELPGAGARCRDRLLGDGHPAEQALAEARSAGVGSVEPGLVEQLDGSIVVCALAPLGRLDLDQARAVAAAADLSVAEPGTALRITPWRRLVIRDLDLPAALAVRELLDAVGLIVGPGTAWSRITACAGRPGCAKSLTDVQHDARVFAAVADRTGPAVHWAGCERGCGAPSGNVVRVLATADGYRIEGGAARLGPADQLRAEEIGAENSSGPVRSGRR